MGLRERRADLIAQKEADKAEREERRTSPDAERWEYKARNLKHVPGMAMESDFNKLGREGWELVAAVDGYAMFKRRAK